ncbi:MAG: N-acetylmuramoyl-L-alanine amidase [Arcobacteraceae bacterium]
MKLLAKTFLIFLLLSQSVFAIGSKYYQEKFNTTKKLYLGSIMSNDKNKEIEYLKKLIRYGEKLDVNTLNYKRELNRLDNTAVLTNRVTRSILTKQYSIKSVTQTNNAITIEFNKNIDSSYIDFNEMKKGSLYFDEFLLKGNFKDATPTKLSMPGVYKIGVYQKRDNLLAITLKNKTNLKTIYILNKNQIIIKVLDELPVTKTNVSKKTLPKVEKPKTNNPKKKKESIKKEVVVLDNNILYPAKKVIVIDAGHGGTDSGASYKRIRFEKNITLNISKYLKEELERFGFKVYLTRSRDKYVKLPHRTKYANSKNADIFISIHANAARKNRASKAHGVESYFLSPARSARAKRVAALENKGDMSGMGWSSKDSLLTILNRAKITAANKMAIDIQKNMLFTLRQKYGEKNIRDGGVREGPFWVLVGAQMPSVLVEVGYISHPREGHRIATKNYQKLIAKGIAKGVESYFIKN